MDDIYGYFMWVMLWSDMVQLMVAQLCDHGAAEV